MNAWKLRSLAATLDPAVGNNREIGDALYAAADEIDRLHAEILDGGIHV